MTLSPDTKELFQSILISDGAFTPKAFCFKKQLAFIEDKAKFKIAVCSRRAGKTIACAVDLINTAVLHPKRVCLYITLSRNNAKKILWPDLLEINRTYNLGAVPNESELSLRFPNQSVIYLSGASDRSEIEKFRGLALTLCYIDEVQSFGSYVSSLIDEVISKALFDYDGTLCLTGTPGPVPTGYFHDCWQSPQWSKHSWTMFDNPFLRIKSGKSPQELLQRDLTLKGVGIDNPTIQRECFGKWTIDTNALVFRYNPLINDHNGIPDGNGWHYIFGIDIGFDDADAIAVIAWNDKYPASYLVEEQIKTKQGITDLANQVDDLIKKYDPDSIVMDTGGLGKKIAEEMNKRFSLPIKAAEKTRKFEYIELLNDALRTNRFYVPRGSRFGQDAMLVEWDKEAAQLKISDRFHSDVCDAVLYAFRESLHWLHTPVQPALKPMSPEWFKEQERLLESQALRNIQKHPDDELIGHDLIHDEGWE